MKEGVFDAFYNSKKAKEYYKQAKLFTKKNFDNIIKISQLEFEIERLREVIKKLIVCAKCYPDDMGIGCAKCIVKKFKDNRKGIN